MIKWLISSSLRSNMLTLRQITLSRGDKILLDKVNVSLYEKQKLALSVIMDVENQHYLIFF